MRTLFRWWTTREEDDVEGYWPPAPRTDPVLEPSRGEYDWTHLRPRKERHHATMDRSF
jgi:hypothetical protein